MGAKRKRVRKLKAKASSGDERKSSSMDLVLEELRREFAETRRRIREIEAKALRKFRRQPGHKSGGAPR